MIVGQHFEMNTSVDIYVLGPANAWVLNTSYREFLTTH
ncbi:hypothetical protein AVDCRST_MAG81-4911 [uncultured Synechococcales cyanobacterium]|uniref:Uncharacterized protein n=1 Tax=uncultured Synechococcales cyanobacterium TaxID=1936017 RepID=A0A6J4VXZ8_9CYAN|nr:hypothetical protein AVDCRST_MAG81-4911 [uncultured Synechococcales cyanobacterium]